MFANRVAAFRAALIGVVAAVPVATLMGWQGMLLVGGVGVTSWVSFVGYGAASGVLIGVVTAHRPSGGLGVTVSGAVMIGLLGWLLFWLTVDPLMHGQLPTWSVGAVAVAYRTLVGDLLHASLVGAGLYAWRCCAPARPPTSTATALTRVVIIGGGFAGVSAAQRFERLVLLGAPLDVTVVSDSNFLLFTPMLAEVASGALEPSHISAPVRSAVAHTRFRRATAQRVDSDARTVQVDGGWVPYDHLVLAVGSVPHVLDLPGVAEHALTMKNLSDAARVRNHVLGLLERADHPETDEQSRRRLLTFVVAGGGFAGAEMVAELFDLVHRVLHLFPGIAPDEPRFVLVHSGHRILPELSPELSDYALARLQARDIEFRLGVRVTRATAQSVSTSDGEQITTHTFVWAAGTRPSPLVSGLAGGHARNGALITDAAFRAVGLERVWAVGDCAAIPDLDSDGAPFPPTAQHALRQGRVVADNIAAVIAGREPTEFRFRAIGVLVALGHRTAAAEIRGRRFSGLAAWLLWRGIYLAKLPGTEKRVRVLLDWVLDMVMPRDITVTTAPDAPPHPINAADQPAKSR